MNVEAGPIVLHVGNGMDETEQIDTVSGAVCHEEEIVMDYKREEAAAAKNTLESNGATTKEDVEIRRLIEERRNTSKGEKQRLKDLGKRKNASGTTKEQWDKKGFNEDSKTSKFRSILGIRTARKRELITKIKNEEGEVFTSRKGIANVFGEFYKKLYDDKEQEEI